MNFGRLINAVTTKAPDTMNFGAVTKSGIAMDKRAQEQLMIEAMRESKKNSVANELEKLYQQGKQNGYTMPPEYEALNNKAMRMQSEPIPARFKEDEYKKLKKLGLSDEEIMGYFF